MSSAEAVHLDMREPVIEAFQPVEHVDFPDSGVISLLMPMEGGKLVELASVGKEGLIGLPVLLGVATVGELAFCQVPSMCWRIPAARFKELLKEHIELSKLCNRYIMMLFEQIAINTGCNRTHSTEQRLARWLLLTHDRCDREQMILTQEFLANMLGVSRTGVNAVAGKFAEQGLIKYVRGKVDILDRPTLEQQCCSCYTRMCEATDKVFGH
ncbi:MAG: Crp/Fnr family transcriptional regulator [Cyanobacteria bacterium REEB67]|nr:Crp/Fnr family transcriptional regulator [Cyanobacteria bacterium REEB67]